MDWTRAGARMGELAVGLDPFDEALRLGRDGALEVYWAPFDVVNHSATVVLAGLTPGRAQVEASWATYRAAMRQGLAAELAMQEAKAVGAFAGPIRSNLIRLLDHIGLNEVLGLRSTSDLFTSARDAVHTTSLLTFPVLRDGRNYSGAPPIRRSRLLGSLARGPFVTQLQAINGTPWIVPLGSETAKGLEDLANEGAIDASRVLAGLPHPSGANAERIAYFLGRKSRDALSSKVNPDLLDSAAAQLRAKLWGSTH